MHPLGMGLFHFGKRLAFRKSCGISMNQNDLPQGCGSPMPFFPRGAKKELNINRLFWTDSTRFGHWSQGNFRYLCFMLKTKNLNHFSTSFLGQKFRFYTYLPGVEWLQYCVLNLPFQVITQILTENLQRPWNSWQRLFLRIIDWIRQSSNFLLFWRFVHLFSQFPFLPFSYVLLTST